MTGNIGSNDVLCGRGGATNNHVGNKRFRAIVAEYQKEYLEVRKKAKSDIARRIVARVGENGGRFLKRDDASNMWVEVLVKKAVEKTSQALREGLDVRHKTIRPEKMPRRESESSEESPRKRTRMVEGEVMESPSITSASGGEAIPDLNEEQAQATDNLLLYLPPPMVSQVDCANVEEV
jgi:hypothetical protein